MNSVLDMFLPLSQELYNVLCHYLSSLLFVKDQVEVQDFSFQQACHAC